MKLYSVLTCITGDYEKVREVVNPSPFAEYILVTDNPNLTSETWTIVLLDLSFDINSVSKYVYIKYHPFEFVNTNTVIWLDGSVQILDDFTTPLMMKFIDSDYSIGEVFNIVSNNCREEIRRWMIGWGTPENPRPFYGYSTGEKTLQLFDQTGYDLNGDQGMVQTTIYMCKNNKKSNFINSMCWNLLMRIGEGESDRQIMSIRSYVLSKYATSDDVMMLSSNTLWCKYFDYRYHNSEESQLDGFANTTVYRPEDYHDLQDRYFYFLGTLVNPLVLKY